MVTDGVDLRHGFVHASATMEDSSGYVWLGPEKA